MKKTFSLHSLAFSLGITVLLIGLSGCTDFSNLEKPTSLTIASNNGTFEFPLGSTSSSLDEYVSLDSIQEMVADTSSDIAVYDYWPNKSGTVQQYVINYPIAEVPLDFGEFLNNSDFISDINQDMSQSIAVDPDTSFDVATINFDLNAGIKEKLNIQPTNNTLTVVEVSSTIDFPSNLAEHTIEVSSPTFSTLIFESGSLRITFDKTDSNDCNEEFVISLGAQLQASDGTVISESDGETEVQNGGSILLDLEDKTLTPSMKLVLSGSYGGGANLSTSHTYKISTGLSDDASFSKVTGLTMTSEDLGSYGTVAIPVTEVPLTNIADYMYSATIAEGSLDFNIPASNWSGVTTDAELNFTGNAIDLSDATVADGETSGYLINKTIDLANKRFDLAGTSLSVSGNISISLSNATVTPSSSGSLLLSGKCNLSKLTDAKVKIANVIDTSSMSQTITQDLPENERPKMVKEAVFSKIGFTGAINCDLPMTGLVVTPSLTSTIFGISTPLTQPIEISDGTGEINMATGDGYSATIEPATDTLDFTVSLSVSGKDTTTELTVDYVTVTELVIGREYSFEPEMTFDYELDHITFSLNDDSVALADEVETGINLRDMIFGSLENADDLLESLQFTDSLKGYFFVTRPEFTATDSVTTDPLAAISGLSGNVYAKYDYTETAEDDTETTYTDQTTYLVGSASENGTVTNETVTLVEQAYDLSELGTADNDYLITTELFRSGTYSIEIDNLAEIFNKYPDNLSFVYDFSLGSSDDSTELTLTGEQLETLQAAAEEGTTSSSLSISLAILFPFEFEIADRGLQVDDVLAMAGETFDDGQDLLKRESSDDDKAENIDKYSDIVKNIYLRYCVDNQIFNNLTPRVSMTFYAQDDTSDTITKDLTLDGDEHRFQLTNTEIDQLLDYYPLQMKVGLEVGGGTLSIPRGAGFEFSGIIGVTTGGEVTVWGGD